MGTCVFIPPAFDFEGLLHRRELVCHDCVAPVRNRRFLSGASLNKLLALWKLLKKCEVVKLEVSREPGVQKPEIGDHCYCT